MKKKNILAVALSAVFAVSCAKTTEGTSVTFANTSNSLCGASEQIEGQITANRTIAADACVILKGKVEVMSGVTLTVSPGARLLAATSTLTYLLVNRGGKLNAIGTAAKPIIFTSGGSVGSRNPSDWGGVVIHGASATNNTTGVNFATDSEIFTGPYGCDNSGNACAGTLGNNDNSGTIQYVRIEFAGKEISAGKEFNGLFLAGVGNGTTIDHVQFHRGSDDGLEIFGGAVNITYAMITDNQDDGFDVDEGWRGIGRYVVTAVPKDGDQGIEYDGVGADTARATNVPLSNFTILGVINKTREGAISVRASGTMSLYNSYIAHFWGDFGIVAVAGNAVTNAAATATAGYDGDGGTFDLRFESNLIECAYAEVGFTTALAAMDNLFCAANDPSLCAAGSTLAARFIDGNANNTYTANCTSPKIARPTTDGTLWGVTTGVAEFRPAAAITGTYTTPQVAPNGTAMTAATYLGAFSGPTDTWADSWTAFPAN